MNVNEPIIDVTPVAHSSKRIHVESHASAAKASSAPSGAASHAGNPFAQGRSEYGYARNPFAQAEGFSASDAARGGAGASQAAGARSPFSALAGVAQVVAGAGLIAIGVPMLVLPGPGVMSIGLGALLMIRGTSNIRGR